MKNHFLISYAGNKREEVLRLYDTVKDQLDDIEYIIEPFCGTCAFSYYLSTIHPNKFKYIINDNNVHLTDLYTIMKDKEKMNELIDKLNELHKTIITKEDYVLMKKGNALENWIYINKIYNIRPGMYPMDGNFKNFDFKKLLDSKIIDFMRNEDVTVRNEDALTIYKEYKNDDNALLFIDPPYLSSCNEFYINAGVEIYKYISENDIDLERSKIMLCLEKNFIIKLLFSNKHIIEYDKLYQTNKRSTKHLIIINDSINDKCRTGKYDQLVKLGQLVDVLNDKKKKIETLIIDKFNKNRY